MKRITIILALALTSTFNAQADTLGFAVGQYDIDGSHSATDFRVDYEYDTSIWLNDLKPWLGTQATTDGTIWLGGGLLYDWSFAETWHLKPGLGVGYYSRGSSDLDLGYPVEFRTQLEVAKDINPNNSLGLAASHLSNANLDSVNPGVEVVTLYWHYRF
ncbi:acyloxyacyl hydrolase [Methylophilus flavus]|uniref:Acyloxyacyl hydrolase n=1 Tax=Methylophilus flavus TaxID=640084 RepID=A0ABW3PBH2_9PROT